MEQSNVFRYFVSPWVSPKGIRCTPSLTALMASIASSTMRYPSKTGSSAVSSRHMILGGMETPAINWFTQRAIRADLSGRMPAKILTGKSYTTPIKYLNESGSKTASV